jgi:hypothetical protein
MLTFDQVSKCKDLKWVSPHSIFICLNHRSNLFYFYDISLKAIVKENKLDCFIKLFMNYIQYARAEYLSSQVIWRFESKQLEND